MVQGMTRQAHFSKQLCIRVMQQIAYTDSPINIAKTSKSPKKASIFIYQVSRKEASTRRKSV